ncbi:putative tubulin polyglutamylase TTLL2 [Rhinophrynus dorsalis]
MADQDDKDNTSNPLVFLLHDSAPSVVRDVLLERGWKEFDETDQAKTEWNLHWRSSAFRASDHDSIKPWQRLNHHQSTAQMVKKDCLARHLKRMKGIYGASYYEFSPEAFILPNDYTAFVAEYTKERREKKSSYWICKPTDMSRGRGIFIFQDIKDLTYDCAVIVQKYITNPLLISGYKCDLRIYVCVTSFCPLTVYVYQEGLVRFATEKFNLNSLDNIFAHLTNTSINKYSTSYTAVKERVGSGCKWTLGQFQSYLHSLEVDGALLWQRIYNIVTLTLLAISSSVPQSPNCFELFGFDILLDDTLKPWLLEVNYSPALTLDCSNDVIVKKKLIHDIIELLNYKTSDGLKYCNSNKKTKMTIQSKHTPFLQASWGCDNSLTSNKPSELKLSISTKDNNSRENEEPKPDQFTRSKSRHISTPRKSTLIDDDNKTIGFQNEVIEKFYNFNDGENLNKRIMTNGKMLGAYPRNTLTSRLRERMNMPQRSPGSRVISKAHALLSNSRYFISEVDKKPPSRVGDFVLVFPFNQSSLIASTNGTDIKSIIQEISKTVHRIS